MNHFTLYLWILYRVFLKRRPVLECTVLYAIITAASWHRHQGQHIVSRLLNSDITKYCGVCGVVSYMQWNLHVISERPCMIFIVNRYYFFDWLILWLWLCWVRHLRIAATKWPIVHPPGDMCAWKAMVMMPAGDISWLVRQDSLAVLPADSSGADRSSGWRSENFAFSVIWNTSTDL
jgi:hypothetical protein